jgi:hypothetical protein
MLQFEFMMTVSAEVGEIQTMGPGPLGERRLIPVTGGTFEGSGMRGTVLPGGNDWQIVRGDGVLDLDARYALREEGGGTIRVVSQGMRHGSPEVLAALGRGEDVDPSKYFFRTAMRFETGDAKLAWLNKTMAVASAVRRARRVELTVYRLL